MSRAPFIPRETLEPMIRTHRALGMTWKEIARAIGKYHPTYLSLLGATWNIGSIDCAGAVDRARGADRLNPDGFCTPVANAKSSAASEATPSDTRQAGSH